MPDEKTRYRSSCLARAFRFTVRATDGHIFPASHVRRPGRPPMGAGLRIKASVDITGFPDRIRKTFQAMTSYGLIPADNGSDMYIQGRHDTRWDSDILHPTLATLQATDFKLIELGWQPPDTDLVFRDGFDAGGPQWRPDPRGITDRLESRDTVGGAPLDPIERSQSRPIVLGASTL